MILAGDLNVAHHEIDIFDPKGKKKIAGFTDEERKSFDDFLKKGHVDTFRHFYPEEIKYTFWSARSNARPVNNGWRLDYFIISNNYLNVVEGSTIHAEFKGSDHCPIRL